MTIPLVDLVAQYHTLKPEIDQAIQRVLESGQFILGSEVSLLEEEVANYLGAKYAVGVASGTDALIMALRALDIGSGDEVLLPAYTFFATAGAVLHVGAIPIFVDIDAQTYCMDVYLAQSKITSRTKAIIPVHLFGHPVDMEAVFELSETYRLKVIEDNAQAFGAEYFAKKTGSFSDAACLSFFPTKNLGGYGDGGMVVTSHADIAEKVRMLRTHGWRKKYFPEELGYNSRLDALQAAILRVKLSHVDEWNQRRRQLAQEYKVRLESMEIQIPSEATNIKHAYHLYVIRYKNRDRIRQVLKEANVSSDVYYPQPPYLATPCRKLGYQLGAFPISDLASKETLAIPLYPEMNNAQIDYIVANIQRAIGLNT